MTEAEKIAQRLDKLPFESEAAALIRSQEAKIKRMAEALRDVNKNSWHGRSILRTGHADALRDAGIVP